MEQDPSPPPHLQADDEWARIAAYLAGEGTPEMRRQVERQIAASEGLADTITRIRHAESLAVSVSPAVDRDTARHRLRARIHSHERLREARLEGASQSPQPPFLGIRRRTGLIASIAAAAVVAISIPVVKNLVPAAGVAQSWEYVTSRAEQASFTLPDGSHVVLAPETRLQYRQNGVADRIVTLEGQAYFTVTHSPSQSFVVHAGDVVTRVLGTSFGVRAYGTDRQTQVAVAEGKVSLENARERVTLLPGDVGQASPDDVPAVAHDAKIVDVFGWMRNQLTFQDVPLRDVALDLERRFDVDIHIPDPALANRRFSGVIKGQSGNDALESIAFTMGARPKWDGRRVTLLAQ